MQKLEKLKNPYARWDEFWYSALQLRKKSGDWPSSQTKIEYLCERGSCPIENRPNFHSQHLTGHAHSGVALSVSWDGCLAVPLWGMTEVMPFLFSCDWMILTTKKEYKYL